MKFRRTGRELGVNSADRNLAGHPRTIGCPARRHWCMSAPGSAIRPPVTMLPARCIHRFDLAAGTWLDGAVVIGHLVGDEN
jgi:hypothetical protein